MEIKLTKAAKNTLAQIYSEYLRRMKDGMSKSAAVYFDENNQFVKKFARENLQELSSAKFISQSILDEVILENPGIIFMEEQKAETIKEWLAFGMQLIP